MSGPSPELAELAAALDGQYELQREIGRGGMGVVYLARDVKLDRRVAIKTLPRHVTDAGTRERFLREARTAASLSHPHIVPIYRADEAGGLVYFAMGYVDGGSLADRVRTQGPLAPPEVAAYLRDVAMALDHAHTHGVIHRDVKAENILIERATGNAMVTDFGIARVAAAAPLTMSGHVLGTVHYMSPEQVAGEAIDGRTDLYALGVVGFFALSAAFPFDSETASAVLVAHVTKRAPSLAAAAPEAPAALVAIVDRCLAREAGNRFVSGAEMAKALDRALASEQLSAASPARLLSDEEARAVWRRASELQALTGTQAITPPPVEPLRSAAGAAGTSGFALERVRASAAEAGIGEQFVSRALGELGLAPAGLASSSGRRALVVLEAQSLPAGYWAGAPLRSAYEARVDGMVDDEEYDQLVELIRRRLGDVGHVSTLGRSLTWTSASPQRRIHVTVVPRAGHTTIRVEERNGQLAGGLYGGIVGGGGGGLGGASVGIVLASTGSPLAAVAIALGLAGSAYGVARTIFKAVVRSRERELKALCGDLATAVADAIDPARH
jgi:eukaryotic-like serine/threonine-protein kinase